MLADLSEIREADFSHLRLASGSLVDVTPDERLPLASSSGYLIAGLALSILLHGLLLLWQKSPSLIPAPQKTPPPLHITLNRTPVIQQSVAEQPAELEPSVETSTIESETVGSKKELVPGQAAPVKKTPGTHKIVEPRPRIITTLTRDEMIELEAERKSTAAPKVTGSISDNVFHPGLRERLRAEERKPGLQRVGSMVNTHIDPSGATIAKVDEGDCLRTSVNSRAGEAQNWYMTSCGGKSESEKIMERVNQDINGKLKFD
jgi:hypothetical protein